MYKSGESLTNTSSSSKISINFPILDKVPANPFLQKSGNLNLKTWNSKIVQSYQRELAKKVKMLTQGAL